MSNWYNTEELECVKYTCAHCGAVVSPNKGYITNWNIDINDELICICPNCDKPTYKLHSRTYPSPKRGMDVKGVDDLALEVLYDEARNTFQVNAYTSCVLCCRKALMHIAVHCGASENLKFIQYIDYLEENGHIPPNGRAWVDKIRKLGNEATHEIIICSEKEAEIAIMFLGMLLKFIYEIPNMLENF